MQLATQIESIHLDSPSTDFINRTLPNELLYYIASILDHNTSAFDEQRDRYARIAVSSRWKQLWQNSTTYALSKVDQVERLIAVLEDDPDRGERATKMALSIEHHRFKSPLVAWSSWSTFERLFDVLPNLLELHLTCMPARWPGGERLTRVLARLTKMSCFTLNNSHPTRHELDYFPYVHKADTAVVASRLANSEFD